MKVGICSLGCKVNIYESELVTNILKNNNYYVNDEEKVYLTMHIQRVINVAREKDK